MSQETERQEDHGNPSVEFVYLNSNAEVKFHANWNDKLLAVWNVAYAKVLHSVEEKHLWDEKS